MERGDGLQSYSSARTQWPESPTESLPYGFIGELVQRHHQRHVGGGSEIVAAIAGSFNVPCVFVSGDAATCERSRIFLGTEVVTTPVKQGLGRFSARGFAARGTPA